MPRCAGIPYAEMAMRKASPGGEAGSPQGLTDEVEAIDYHHRLVRHCSLRPHPVRLEPDHRSRGMTATGSHIDFGFAARSTTLQGKALAGATSSAPAAPHPSALTGSHLPPGEGIFFATPGACVHIQQKTIGVPISRRTDGFYCFFLFFTAARSPQRRACTGGR